MNFDWKGFFNTLVQNRPLVTQLVTNIIALLVSFGLIQMSSDQVQFNALEVTSAIFVVLNIIGLFIGNNLEKRQDAARATKGIKTNNAS